MKRIGGAKRRRQTGSSRAIPRAAGTSARPTAGISVSKLRMRKRALGAKTTAAPQPAAPGPEVAPASPRPVSLVIEQSVRSGQSIVFRDGDVTVIGSVGSGAEIIAGGSIHVYGALRGRAFAGTAGDAGARIFCNNLDAELLAINGLYRVADSLDSSLRGRPVQAWLEGRAIAMAPLE
jgi:septum site-determining protein MinC